MPDELHDFSAQHLPAAAAALARRHRADLEREPLLPQHLASTAAAQVALDAVLQTPGAAGVVAVHAGTLTGYLLGVPLLPDPWSRLAQTVGPRSLRIPYVGHARLHPEQADLYRELYQALAERWVAAGYLTHYVTVSACDAPALAAWWSLGFGQDRVTAVRSLDVTQFGDRQTDATLRRATAGDLETVVRLASANDRYHARSPIFDAYFPEAGEQLRREQQALLSAPDCAVWLAERAGEAVGILTLQPSQEIVAPTAQTVHLDLAYLVSEARAGGLGTALLVQALRWARETGFDLCTATWSAANVLGARYWIHAGFRPLSHRLRRQIDERSAWGKSIGATDVSSG